ncbi:MAG: response regulator [Proteobacteria bacterium]|nr:response regulator [Pseudomonadota bacterium]
MTAKRALIVDDSKSARVVLSRLLEKHELTVDTTDSAESALAYLRDHRPDVIFMDHVMSGMDGLTAVQAIKRDPATASIPIMMYTSQDGELYATEARASGAAGVLPKRMSPADIASALYELKLLPEQRAAGGVAFDCVQLPAVGGASPDAVILPGAGEALLAAPDAPTAAALRSTLEPILQEQNAELRRFVVASLESLNARLLTEVAAPVGAAVQAALAAERAAQPPPVVVAAPEPEPVPPPRRPLGWIVGTALGLLLAIAAGAVAYQQHRELGAATRELASARQQAAAAEAAAAAARRAAAPEAQSAQQLAVPYGEAPLAGTRLTALAVLLAELEGRGFAGSVSITTSAGDFCLTGNPSEGFAPAPGEMPANRCDVVGNPYDDALRPEERDPPALAALLGGVRDRSHGAIEVRVEHLPRGAAGGTYPAAPEASAAQWNAVAALLNHVEFSVAQRPATP